LVLERIAEAAIALVTSACTLARIDAALAAPSPRDDHRAAAELYLRMAGKRFDDALKGLRKNHDREVLDAARAVLRK
jgi:hypothetical protein